MLDSIIYEIANLKWLIITMAVSCTVICLALYFCLNSFTWNKNKVRIFSLLFGFDTIDCICVSLMISRSIYVIYLAIDNNNISAEYLITLLIMSILISLLKKDFLELFTNILTSVAVYVILYLQSSLRYFYNFVEHDVVVLLMIVFLCIFTILYSIYSLVSSYNHMIALDKRDPKTYESLKSTNKIKWPRIKRSGKLKSSSSN